MRKRRMILIILVVGIVICGLLYFLNRKNVEKDVAKEEKRNRIKVENQYPQTENKDTSEAKKNKEHLDVLESEREMNSEIKRVTGAEDLQITGNINSILNSTGDFDGRMPKELLSYLQNQKISANEANYNDAIGIIALNGAMQFYLQLNDPEKTKLKCTFAFEEEEYIFEIVIMPTIENWTEEAEKLIEGTHEQMLQKLGDYLITSGRAYSEIHMLPIENKEQSVDQALISVQLNDEGASIIDILYHRNQKIFSFKLW